MTEPSRQPLKPSQVDAELSWFDRMATSVSGMVAKAWFFATCVVIVAVWAPSYFVFRDLNLWQLIINTLTTIITFLLVALLQNTQSRADKAVQRKLNAIADSLADLMEAHRKDDATMTVDVAELRHAVGLEHREGS
jgi:low affinity Fe/Cu permease